MMRWKFVKDNFIQAERIRIKHDDYNSKCDELKLGYMRIRSSGEKTSFIKAAFNQIQKLGPYVHDGKSYELKITRQVNSTTSLRMQIQSRELRNGCQWFSCLDVLYTKSKPLSLSYKTGLIPGPDKFAHKAYSALGEALWADIVANVEHRMETTTLGTVIAKVEKTLGEMGDVKDDDTGKYGLQGKNIWHLFDEDEENISKLNLLLMYITDTTYLRKEQQ